MDDLFYQTKLLNTSNRHLFNQLKSEINKNKGNLSQQLNTSIGSLIVNFQTIEHSISGLMKIYKEIQNKKSINEIKNILNDKKTDFSKFIGNEPKPSKNLKGLIKDLKSTGVFENRTLENLDKLRENRNYFSHNIVFNNLSDFLYNKKFQKKTLKVVHFSIILLAQQLKSLYSNFREFVKNYDEDLLKLLDDLMDRFQDNPQI